MLRCKVGYTNGISGERVEEAPLSYNRLIAFSPMDRKTPAAALAHAQSAGRIRTVSAGRFSPDKRRQKATVYAVRWADDADVAGATVHRFHQPDGSRTPPATVPMIHQETVYAFHY